MTVRTRRIAVWLGAAVLLLGTLSGAAPQTAQRPGPPPAAQRPGSPDDPDAKEYRNYRLSMDNVSKFVAA
jgi:hypothetical protein